MIDGGEARWTVEDLPPGDYALLAYHDENGNRELDFRPLGIPKEPSRSRTMRPDCSARRASSARSSRSEPPP